MIRPCQAADRETVFAVINEGALAYAGTIPADCYHTPYMSLEELTHEIAQGVSFWGFEQQGTLQGVMGMQDVKDVTLIRHAYVRRESQGKGIGAALLTHLRQLTTKPLLIGAWTDALWAIRFYERHGFAAVSRSEKERLLQTYWTVSPRQIDTSVVLADQRWRDRIAAHSAAPQV